MPNTVGPRRAILTPAPFTKLANGARMMEIGHSYSAYGMTNNASSGLKTLQSTDINIGMMTQAMGAGVRVETWPSADPTISPIGGTAKNYSGSSYGVGSETTTQTLARIDVVAANVLNAVTAIPDVALITNNGVNNDFGPSSAITDAQTDYRAMIDKLLAAGVQRIIFHTMAPVGMSLGTSRAGAKFGAFNSMIRGLASYGPSRVSVVDVAAAFGAPDEWVQAPAGWLQSDNIHPSRVGAGYIAKATKNLLDYLVDPGFAWYENIANPATLTQDIEFLRGTSTAFNTAPIVGNHPTNTFATAAGSLTSAVVQSLRAHPQAGVGIVPAGAQYLDLAVTPAGVNTLETIQIVAGSVNLTALRGLWVQMAVDVDIPASAYISDTLTSIQENGTSPTVRRIDYAATDFGSVANEARSLTLMSQPMEVSATATTTTIVAPALTLRAAAAVVAGAAPFTFTIKRFRIKVVPDPKVAWHA